MNTSVACEFSAESFKNEEYELYGGILQKTAGSQWAENFLNNRALVRNFIRGGGTNPGSIS